MSKMSREDLLKEMSGPGPRTRKTTVRHLDGKVEQDAAAFIQEEVTFIDTDMTVRQASHISSRTCSFGHLTDQQVRLVGKCERCGSITCSTPGCSLTCSRCGKALCRRHAHVYGPGEAYCSSCRLPVLIRWTVLGRRR